MLSSPGKLKHFLVIRFQNIELPRKFTKNPESSLLHAVPHGKVVTDCDQWDLSFIASTMDEALAKLSELGIRVRTDPDGKVML
eukprot:3096603-Karenia_brevis.AAC.1